jgi:protein TonB
VTLVRSPLWPSLLVAGVLHAAAAAWVVSRPVTRLKPRRPPTAVRLVAQRPAPPTPAKPPAPVKPPLVSSPAGAQARRPDQAAPPAAPRPPGPPPPPRRFAVSMDALVTSGTGGIAMPTTAGPTAARGNPSASASTPVGDNSPFAARAVDVTDLEQGPRLLRQPSKLDMRALYPEAARREGVEANVKVELLLDDTGAVREVRIVDGAAGGFDEAARQLARLLAFSPGTRGGRAVAVRYAWTFKFRLDE